MSGWRKSSRSNGNGGNNCVEVFVAEKTGDVFVRHSRHPRAQILQFTAAEWEAFIAGVKDGEFDS